MNVDGMLREDEAKVDTPMMHGCMYELYLHKHTVTSISCQALVLLRDLVARISCQALVPLPP